MDLDDFYSEDRSLTKTEIVNLEHKKNSIPVEYFRKNLFNATTRTSCELKKPKVIFDDGTNKMQINRSLHQKHRDILSILFTDNKNLKVNEDGSIEIRTNLYYIAKEMGYDKPKDGTHVIKGFLYDLRHTEITFKTKKKDVTMPERGGHRLIGEYKYDEKSGDYIVNIPSQTAKYRILNYAVEIPKEINRKIIAIPNNLAKVKALVSYMLSNQALKNGIFFDKICDKLDINIGARKSEFLKEIKENDEILKEFNISFDQENQILKYKQIEEIRFHAPVKVEKLVGSLDQQMQQPKEELKKEEVKKKSSFENLTLFSSEEVVEEMLGTNEERYKKLITSFINSPITINNMKYIFVGLNKNSNDQILLEMKDNENRILMANTQFTTYYLVFNEFFKELV